MNTNQFALRLPRDAAERATTDRVWSWRWWPVVFKLLMLLALIVGILADTWAQP